MAVRVAEVPELATSSVWVTANVWLVSVVIEREPRVHVPAVQLVVPAGLLSIATDTVPLSPVAVLQAPPTLVIVMFRA